MEKEDRKICILGYHIGYGDEDSTGGEGALLFYNAYFTQEFAKIYSEFINIRPDKIYICLSTGLLDLYYKGEIVLTMNLKLDIENINPKLTNKMTKTKEQLQKEIRIFKGIIKGYDINTSHSFNHEGEIVDFSNKGYFIDSIKRCFEERLKAAEDELSTLEKCQSSTRENEVWSCRIGSIGNVELPSGSDAPMRQAVEKAYYEITGRYADINSSGWGEKLTDDEIFSIKHTQDGKKKEELHYSDCATNNQLPLPNGEIAGWMRLSEKEEKQKNSESDAEKMESCFLRLHSECGFSRCNVTFTEHEGYTIAIVSNSISSIFIGKGKTESEALQDLCKKLNI